MKCGNCKGDHATAGEVRTCYGGGVATMERGESFVKPVGSEPPATDKQANFIARLRAERELPDLPFNGTKNQASAEITRLLDMPKTATAGSPAQQRASQAAEEGLYKVGDDFYKVQQAVHGSGRRYAKLLQKPPMKDGKVDLDEIGGRDKKRLQWDLAPGMVFRLTPEQALTHEEARAFGSLYGFCCSCGLQLTDQRSIDNGYGEKCASNHGWPY